jgi:hypothetical protein
VVVIGVHDKLVRQVDASERDCEQKEPLAAHTHCRALYCVDNAALRPTRDERCARWRSGGTPIALLA